MPFALPVPPHWSTRGPLRRTLLDPQQEYLAFACQLLALIKDGQADSDEAMRLRTQMDGPWARMTAEQQIHVCHLVDDMSREADPRRRLRVSHS
jgi:hypothetical protein